jgi:hypothetical protein
MSFAGAGIHNAGRFKRLDSGIGLPRMTLLYPA